MPRFDRTYRLLVGKPGEKGTEVLPPMRITFDVAKDAKEEPNEIQIRVWNLAPDTREAMEAPDQVVALYAGYTEEDGALLLAYGTLVEAWTYFDGPDVVTELTALDGYAELRDTVVSIGYGPGVSSRTVARDIARQMGLRLVMADDVPARTWANGFSHHGAARVALHKIVAGTGLEYSVQNGELQIVPRLGTTKRQALVLAADSGLIGHPERTRKGAREKARVSDKVSGDNKDIVSARQQVAGWHVRSLLLPTVVPGDLVKLESRTVEGFFRVETVRHTGDYGGAGDFMTDLELVDPNAPKDDK